MKRGDLVLPDGAAQPFLELAPDGEEFNMNMFTRIGDVEPGTLCLVLETRHSRHSIQRGKWLRIAWRGGIGWVRADWMKPVGGA